MAGDDSLDSCQVEQVAEIYRWPQQPAAHNLHRQWTAPESDGVCRQLHSLSKCHEGQ